MTSLWQALEDGRITSRKGAVDVLTEGTEKERTDQAQVLATLCVADSLRMVAEAINNLSFIDGRDISQLASEIGSIGSALRDICDEFAHA